MSKIRRHSVKRKGNACSGICIRDEPLLPGERRKEVLAVTVCINSICMGGDVGALILHLRDDHGMTFEQIQIGIDEIRSETGECFEGWESYYNV